MTRSWRIGLSVGLAIFGGWTAAEAQPQTAVDGGNRQAPSAVGGSAASRRTSASSYNRLTSTTRRASASSSTRGTAAGAGDGPYDPLRPYSAQARQAAAAVSPTRLSEAPPPPPRTAPPARYDYYPNLRAGQHPNANVPQVRRHCTPSRGGVLAGSQGGARPPAYDRASGLASSRGAGPGASLGNGR